MRRNTARLVSFSGIDGAGKSTQIQALESHLQRLGFRTTIYTFWDDVVVFPSLREFISHKVFQGDKGVGSPEKPITRRDKNVSSWYTAIARSLLYLLDALNLRLFLARLASVGSADFIIFDRYIYDELANLRLNSWLARTYARLLIRLSPRPDIAFLVDADPETARSRKPEYPLQFLRQNREAYLKLGEFIREMTIVDPLSIKETTLRITELMSIVRSHLDIPSANLETESFAAPGQSVSSND